MLDTFKNGASGLFQPGAITFQGRKKIDFLRWQDKSFSTQQEADDFVRAQFKDRGLTEVSNEGELRR